MDTLKMSSDYDISLDGKGMLAISKDSESLCERLRLDLESNKNWKFSDKLGIDWVNEAGDGYLQIKLTEALMTSAVYDKINSYSEVVSIEEVVGAVDRSTDTATFSIVFRTIEGEYAMEVEI